MFTLPESRNNFAGNVTPKIPSKSMYFSHKLVTLLLCLLNELKIILSPRGWLLQTPQQKERAVLSSGKNKLPCNYFIQEKFSIPRLGLLVGIRYIT